jgi:anti-sigma regulatory factor (Ser/Thr protein kinase)
VLGADPRGVDPRGVDPRIVDQAVLVTSELVTNAVLHGASPLRLELHVADDVLHVLVEDGDDHEPVPVPDSEAGPEGGFGLRIVERLADEWGIAPRDHGKAVWFRMSLHERDAAGNVVEDLVRR